MTAEPVFRVNFTHDMHLSLRDQKYLAVQIIAARTLLIPVHTADRKLNRNLAKIVKKIKDIAEPELDQHDVSLPDFLVGLAFRLRRFVKTWHFSKHSGERDYIARFMIEARFLKLGPALLGQSNSQSVHWLGETFSWLAAIAGKIYGPALNGNGGLMLRLRTLPHTTPELLGETAFSIVNDAAVGRAADVGIKLPIQHFSEDHFCQLAFIIFHEIFVHGPQAWETDGCRKIVGEHCALREGFVDAAAYAALKAELETNSLCLPRLLHPFQEEVRAGIGVAHRHRSETTRPGKTSEDEDTEALVRKFRMRGRTAFERLAEKNTFALHLALCLNLLELSDKDDGSRIVDCLDQAIRRPRPPAGKQIRDSSTLWLDQLCQAAADYDLQTVKFLIQKALRNPFQADFL